MGTETLENIARRNSFNVFLCMTPTTPPTFRWEASVLNVPTGHGRNTPNRTEAINRGRRYFNKILKSMSLL